MKIDTIEISGLTAALMALRLPFRKEERSEGFFDIVIDKMSDYVDDEKYKDTKHMESQTVLFIDHDDIELLSRLVRTGDEHAKVARGIITYARITAPVYWWCEMETYRAGHERLCSESTMHIDCKGMHGTELQHVKSIMPMGKELTKIDYFSYQCLRNIVKQRHNHRLPEWHEFIDWIKTLPFAEELILTGLNYGD